MIAHWITAAAVTVLWVWWARSEWVLAAVRPRPRRRENPR